MTEFLAENNACGQNLLRIVSFGNTIIAELFRLKDYIPDVFRLETKAEQQKYADIIYDFHYLKVADAVEKRIEDTPELQDLDDEVRENYLDLLTRFYLVFESTHQYAVELTHFLQELNDGYYIQQSLESVLQDDEGKQLMCESLYLFGVILLTVDYHIPGLIRERLLISYYRYSGAKASVDSNIDDVCMLLRSTGFVAQPTSSVTAVPTINSKTPVVPNYPESFFARYPFDETFVAMVIGRLRCDDVYNQLAIYPHPDHRSTALSTQAGMLYVCLYFAPKILHQQVAQMREIVDKFFADNWVVSVYMGITVSLVDAWDSFKAAKAALQPVIEPVALRGFCVLHQEKMLRTLHKSGEIVRDGVLSDAFVLKNIGRIVDLVRQCNVELRWYLLHTSRAVVELSRGAQKAGQVLQTLRSELQLDKDSGSGSSAEIFELLLNCSQLELTIKDVLRQLLAEKAQRWAHFKAEALARVEELNEAFMGSRPLAKIEKNPQLRFWFGEIAKEIGQLEAENPRKAGRVLIQLIQALEEVEEFHNLQANMQVRQYLLETRDYLHQMIHLINIREDILINLQLITDLSYAWRLMDRDFTGVMQERIKKHTKSVTHLRAVFLKLASALEIPLLRINQARSEDLESVSQYYSSELANYMRRVLQIIPESMFKVMAYIIRLQTDSVKEMPTRLDKDKLREYAQFEHAHTIAKMSHNIALYTEGVLMMKKTLVGVIELDPKQLLEDGIRKELVWHLANALNSGLIFTRQHGGGGGGGGGKPKDSSAASTSELEEKLLLLSRTIDGYRRSFQYLQDYMSVHGLKILQEEFIRIINYNVEKECNSFLRNKVQDWQSQYQSLTIPVPSFAPITGDLSGSNNFIGRLAREILHCTDPKQTIYVQLKATWYRKRAPHAAVLDSRFFGKVREAIGPAGLVGLDRLYSHMFANEIRENLLRIQKNLTHDKMWQDNLTELSLQLESRQHQAMQAVTPIKYYETYYGRWLKVWPTILDWLMGLGHKQIIRQQLAYELNRSGKCSSKNLESSLETFQRALLLELHAGKDGKDAGIYSGALLAETNSYLMFTGSYEPLEQVFVPTKASHHMALFFGLFTMAHVNRLQFSVNTNSMLAKSSKDPIDGTPLLFGVVTVLKQFPRAIQLMYLTYMCQFASHLMEANMSGKNEFSVEAVTTIHLLEIFCRIASLPRKLLTERITELVLNEYELIVSNIK